MVKDEVITIGFDNYGDLIRYIIRILDFSNENPACAMGSLDASQMLAAAKHSVNFRNDFFNSSDDYNIDITTYQAHAWLTLYAGSTKASVTNALFNRQSEGQIVAEDTFSFRGISNRHTDPTNMTTYSLSTSRNTKRMRAPSPSSSTLKLVTLSSTHMHTSLKILWQSPLGRSQTSQFRQLLVQFQTGTLNRLLENYRARSIWICKLWMLTSILCTNSSNFELRYIVNKFASPCYPLIYYQSQLLWNLLSILN
jgi:hypothetical protein